MLFLRADTYYPSLKNRQGAGLSIIDNYDSEAAGILFNCVGMV
jgi:hypothetical protein